MILHGINKSAILLMLLGPEETIKIFKYLKVHEIRKIITAILDINCVSQKDVNKTLQDALVQYKHMKKNIFLDHDVYIKQIKSKFLSKKKNRNFFKKNI